MSMAVSIARGHVTPMDLFLVRGPGPDIRYDNTISGILILYPDIRAGFLSFGWGLITDVDIDSEALRGLGSLRFTIYALLKVSCH